MESLTFAAAFARLHALLAEPDVAAKLVGVKTLAAEWPQAACPPAGVPEPVRGVPERPVRVAPEALSKRNPNTPAGRAALFHAVVHIEFSAIDLALDHALRFPGLPAAYYAAWVAVAAEEAEHFVLLRDHLRAMGYDYGDFPVHDGLWEMALKTAGDPLARMALIPRLLEARGLDVTPPIQARLEKGGDEAGARLLDTILRDEVGHVALGDRWFRHLCAARGLAAAPTFRHLILAHRAPWPQGPLNEKARRAAGFSESELQALLQGPVAVES